MKLLLASAAVATDVSGHVEGVMDRDTFEVLHNQHPKHIRPGASTARRKVKDAVADLAFRKEVRVKTHGHDKHKGTIAEVVLADGTDVNHTQIKESWCWWFRKYVPGNTVLEGLQKEERERRKGL